jgi:hypothetical protein
MSIAEMSECTLGARVNSGHSPTRLKHLVVRRMLRIYLLEQPLFDQVDPT